MINLFSLSLSAFLLNAYKIYRCPITPQDKNDATREAFSSFNVWVVNLQHVCLSKAIGSLCVFRKQGEQQQIGQGPDSRLIDQAGRTGQQGAEKRETHQLVKGDWCST